MKAMPIWDAKTWDGTHVDEVPGSLRDPKYQTWVMGHDTIAFVSFPWFSNKLLASGSSF
jgi:salicylate hydroxylase